MGGEKIRVKSFGLEGRTYCVMVVLVTLLGVGVGVGVCRLEVEEVGNGKDWIA